MSIGALKRIQKLRTQYLERLKGEVLFEKTYESDGQVRRTASIADTSQKSSRRISAGWSNRIQARFGEKISSQTAGTRFEHLTRGFLEDAFTELQSLRPGHWGWKENSDVNGFDQYFHLRQVTEVLENRPELKTTFGEEYVVKPDIVVYRRQADPSLLGGRPDDKATAVYAPLLEGSSLSDGRPILHASISCKLTLRSDRAQNTRTEALNLIRNRKGRSPHIVAVTCEPVPNRLASLALGTGDIDCVYHAGLRELEEAVSEVGSEDAQEMLAILVSGRRLRDISDLAVDLAS